MIDEDTEYKMKQGDFSQKRILTVDDEIINSKLIARIMKDEPMYEIVSATSGRQALEILDEQHFDLIMLDVNMPEMDGHEATRKIRASSHPEAKNIPIIAMAADAFTENVAEAYAAGMNGLIPKPIDIKLLFETLQKYVNI